MSAEEVDEHLQGIEQPKRGGVGGGRLVATATDPDGNVLSLLQDREEARVG